MTWNAFQEGYNKPRFSIRHLVLGYIAYSIIQCFTGCGVDAKVNPVIQVVPDGVLDAQTYCPDLPDAEHYVLVRKL